MFLSKPSNPLQSLTLPHSKKDLKIIIEFFAKIEPEFHFRRCGFPIKMTSIKAEVERICVNILESSTQDSNRSEAAINLKPKLYFYINKVIEKK